MAQLGLLLLAVFWRCFVTLWSVSAQNTIRSRPIPRLVRNVPIPTRVGDDQKLSRNVSMSTYVSSWDSSAWSDELMELFE